ncbi:dethiobiotin synthase [Paenibacillus lutrae]|uniref:ATP-dependent dethiobiotin synthetase BioD n=1 Tax=Paenibacillus lutrae TaxID=2078573 RepID=A0A7X3FF62_9BACL|nr:dethiobiotin synthase [Paenibacillus lutrae]MVO98383.1 dethiobiotin synthase [Paenibacillus lutrae]
MTTFSGLFVTGTDTGVGKTIVTAALAAALRAEGRHAGIWKPVQSGAQLGSGTTDAERLLRYTGIRERPENVASFSFAAPLAPLIAAREANISVTLKDLVSAGETAARRYETLIVEGAGGAAVPLTEDSLTADLIKVLGLPALIIARSGLGTVNHTALTASYLQQREIPVIGVIMNDGAEAGWDQDPSVATNAELIERISGLRVLGRFPALTGEIHPQVLTDTVRRSIDLDPVRQALGI